MAHYQLLPFPGRRDIKEPAINLLPASEPKPKETFATRWNTSSYWYPGHPIYDQTMKKRKLPNV